MMLVIAAAFSLAQAQPACASLSSEAAVLRTQAGSAANADQQVALKQQALVWYGAAALACRDEKLTEQMDAAMAAGRPLATELNATGWTADHCRRRFQGITDGLAMSDRTKAQAPNKANYVERVLSVYAKSMKVDCGY